MNCPRAEELGELDGHLGLSFHRSFFSLPGRRYQGVRDPLGLSAASAEVRERHSLGCFMPLNRPFHLAYERLPSVLGCNRACDA